MRIKIRFACTQVLFNLMFDLGTRVSLCMGLLLVSLSVPEAMVPEVMDGRLKAAEQLGIRIPGEFEPQRAIVLSVSDWQPHHSRVLTQIVSKTSGFVDVLILYNSLAQKHEVIKWIETDNCPTEHVRLCQLELDTVWLRDFSPLIAESQSGPVAIDFLYYGGARPKDEKMPSVWSSMAGTGLKEVRWTIQGGNFLSNGDKIVITTTKIFEENTIQFPYTPGAPATDPRAFLIQEVVKDCQLDQLVVLEPLQYESTKHADLFASFLADDTVVVASVDPYRDPVNAQILDRNARKLAQVRLRSGKTLKVLRLPIPAREGNAWSAYTNIIQTERLILFPVFDNHARETIDHAKSFYEQHCPGRKVEVVDITTMKLLEGALHCLTANVPQGCELPSIALSFDEACKTHQ